ncbi:MAG TPA: hypothetical protein ENK19_09605 [Acidobacteria bacterium]|nr:hypothetical protein [Acidobacteriota bacterium]
MKTWQEGLAVWLFGALAVVASISPAGATTISGRVTDESGASPPSVWVAATDPATDVVLDSTQSTDGTYALEVPDGQDIALIAIALSGRSLAGYELHEYTDAIARLSAAGDVMHQDLHVRRCREYLLQARRPDGTVHDDNELPPGSFPVDGGGEATAELLWAVDNPVTGARLPSLCVPLGERRTLIFRFDLPGAGLLNLPMTLDGGDFTAEGQGGELVDVNRELALTQLERLEIRMGELAGGGFVVPSELMARARAARALFEQAEGMAPAVRAGTELQVASEAILTLEGIELAKARWQALISRRGALRVRVMGADGAPVAGIRVSYRQISHDFRFGIFGQLATTGQAVYDRMAQGGLNFVTAGYYWADIEREPGAIDYDYIDHHIGVTDLADRGWRVKGHPLTWLYDLAMPDWLKGVGFAELKRSSVEHVTTLVTHYRDRVHTWDVNNEAANYWATGGLSRPQLDDYLRAVFAAARTADPTAELILNSPFDWFGRDRLEERLDGRTSYVTLSIPAFVRRAIDTGVDFDIIGQQMYNGGGITLFRDLGVGPVQGAPSQDLGFLAQVLRRLSAFGKPIHITENSVSSTWDPDWIAAGAGYWHQPWSEQTQADFLEAFYRLCFGTPAVRAITWWDAVDDNPFIDHGGLFRADGTPKPAFLRLESLIREWTTVGAMVTSTDGVAAVQAFAGLYEVSAEAGGRTFRRTVHVAEGRPATVTIDLRGPRAPAPVRRQRPAATGR